MEVQYVWVVGTCNLIIQYVWILRISMFELCGGGFWEFNLSLFFTEDFVKLVCFCINVFICHNLQIQIYVLRLLSIYYL